MFKNRDAFTLIELVVVIMILGVLSGVAAPKLLSVSGEATDANIKQSLAVIRDAIEFYAADHGGALPPCTEPFFSFQNAVSDYIRGDFPTCPVGNQNNFVRAAAVDPLVADGISAGWIYSTSTGEFKCNSMSPTASEPSITYDQL